MACMVNVEEREIVLTGFVGETYWDDGFTPADVIVALAQIGRDQDLTVRVNSGGGYATDGSAIHSALTAHKGKVTVVVEGLAASAASLIVMAGDDVAMALGSVMMIHDPATITWGTAAEHQVSVEFLNALGDAYAEVYAEKTGRPAADMRTLMKAETWMTAQEAVDGKFADRLAAANANEPTAFAYGAYAHAPQKMVALATAKGWSAKPTSKATAPAASPQPQEPTMTGTPDTTQAVNDGVKAALARIDAITGHAEAKGREALASHLARNTTMSVEDAAAALKAAPVATAEAAPAETFEERKARAATDDLGAPTPLPDAKAKAKAGWDKAVSNVNARLN